VEYQISHEYQVVSIKYLLFFFYEDSSEPMPFTTEFTSFKPEGEKNQWT